jgi:3-methyladenine DNA glycosylase AlkD
MNYAEVMATLEAAGSAQTRKTYSKHGATMPMFGVNFSVLRPLAKKLKKDHPLALQLWDSGNFDARQLALMVVDVAALDAATIDKWVSSLSDYGLADAFGGIVAQTAFAKEKFLQWQDHPNEWVQTAAWNILGGLAGQPENGLPDSFFTAHLATIQRDIHQRPNRVRYNMNSAVIAIGTRNPALQAQAIAAAKVIGVVDVDHGDTNCETPNTASYIEKTLDYRQKKAAEAAEKAAKKPAKKAAKKAVPA